VYRSNLHTVLELQVEFEAVTEEITGDILRDTVDKSVDHLQRVYEIDLILSMCSYEDHSTQTQ
jgi:hypothetical protein